VKATLTNLKFLKVAFTAFRTAWLPVLDLECTPGVTLGP